MTGDDTVVIRFDGDDTVVIPSSPSDRTIPILTGRPRWPGAYAVVHEDDPPCRCHGRTEAETAAPYSLLLLGMFTVAVAAMVLGVVFG